MNKVFDRPLFPGVFSKAYIKSCFEDVLQVYKSVRVGDTCDYLNTISVIRGICTNISFARDIGFSTKLTMECCIQELMELRHIDGVFVASTLTLRYYGEKLSHQGYDECIAPRIEFLEEIIICLD